MARASVKRFLNTFHLRLRSLFRRDRVEQELDEEMRYHLERQIETNIAQGLTPQEARYAGLRRMGGIEQRKEECRDMRRVNFIDDLLRDVRYGLRGLKTNRGFAIVAILTMALGIGANTAIFSVVHAALLRPLPYPNPDRLIVLESVSPSAGANIRSVSPGDYRDYRQQAATLNHLAGYSGDGFGFQLDERPETVRAARITENFFDALGIQPFLGRSFNPDEMLTRGPRAVVLSYRLWQGRFGGDRAVIGKQIKSGESSVTVIGVMPPDFKFPRYAEAWTPIAGDSPEMERRSSRYWQTIARLRDGQSIEAARAEVTAIAARLSDSYPKDDLNWKAQVSPVAHVLTRSYRDALLILMAAVSIVLLIACANVSSLMLARSTSRRREVAVRLALGASRWRLVRQFTVEGALVSLLGAGAGIALARWGIGAFFALLPETSLTSLLQLRESVRIDAFVLVFTAGISILTGIVFALVPAWHSVRQRLAESMRGDSAAGREQRFHKSLVVFEFACAVVLLAGAGLLTHSFVRMLSVDYGYDPTGLVIMDLPQPAQNRQVFRERALEAIKATPGVRSAALMSYLTFGGLTFPFNIEGRELPGGDVAGSAYSSVTADYFRVLKTPLIAGREFNDGDSAAVPGVAIINETLARQYFARENPIGRKIVIAYLNQRIVREIVGVAGDIRQDQPTQPVRPEVFVHWPQLPWLGAFLVVRAEGDPFAVRNAVQRAIWSIDKNLPVSNARTVDQILGGQVSEPRLYMVLLGLFAGIALFLAVIGIYGLLSTIVNRHLPDMAIRVAMGARRSDVLRLILGEGMRLSAAGLLMGLLATMGLTGFLKSLLFGVSATDPVTLAGVSILLFVVGLLACYIPARRATRVDPMAVLRHE